MALKSNSISPKYYSYTNSDTASDGDMLKNDNVFNLQWQCTEEISHNDSTNTTNKQLNEIK